MINILKNIFSLIFIATFVCGYRVKFDEFLPQQQQQYTDNLVPNLNNRDDYPIIRLTLGYLRGNWLSSTSGKRYAAYKGIPFAQPPVGNLRFQPPQEKKAWQGIRNALNHGSQCPQQLFVLDKYVGHEDCLYLNLYVPQPHKKYEQRNSYNELLPIMFFIHGGAWTMGAGDMDDYLYGPDRVIDEDVILVTTNYRLGALGFLYLEDKVQGNMGLKDQAMALKLIKANARSFGGDPNRIIIMGESSGAASAEYHTLNPVSSKLISGVIAQSGSILAPWAWTRPDVLGTRTRRLAKMLKCPEISEANYIIDCLKRARPEEIVKYQFATNWSPLQIPIGISFSPTAEPRDSPNAFITDCPRDILIRLEGTSQRIPYLTGFNTAEGQLFSKIAVGLIDTVIQAGARVTLGLPKSPKHVEYLRQKPYITQSSPSIIDNLIGDYEFKAPIMETSKYHARAGANVFLYHFSFAGRNNFARLFWLSQTPTHMDELTYFFQGRGVFGGLPRLIEASPEAVVSKRLIRMWTNFAKTGHPTPLNNTGVNVHWPVGPSKMLTIGEELTIDNSPASQTSWSNFINRQCFA